MPREAFRDALRSRILLFDGAMGTEIQKKSPTKDDFPGGHDGFNDGLTITHPEWISDIHKSYLDAGADCIETNTFGSNRIKLDEYGMGDKTVEMNHNAAQLAVRAVSDAPSPTRYVIGTMGPTGYLPSSTDPDLGQMPISDIRAAFELQAEGLVSGGVDALLVETSQDILEVKLAVDGAHNAMRKISQDVPVIANVTLDQYGKMLLGTNVQAAYTTLGGMKIDVFGLNCSTGPQEMASSIRWLAENSAHDILVVPNAGMPVNEGGVARYDLPPSEFGAQIAEFLDLGRVRIIGGCCGTDPKHIAALRTLIDQRK